MDWLEVHGYKTDDGVKYTFNVPKPRVVSVDYPYFVVEWMGKLTRGKILSQNCIQVGNIVLWRDSFDSGSPEIIHPDAFNKFKEETGGTDAI